MSKILQISDAELTHAMEREFRSGEEFHKANAQYRERDIHHEVKDAKRTVLGLGKMVAAVDSWTWFKMREVYGEEAWHDKGFIKDYQRHNPKLSPNKA